MAELKRCCSCKVNRPLDSFANTCMRPDGKQDVCRECMSIIRKRRRQKLKEGSTIVIVPDTKWCPSCTKTLPKNSFYSSISKTCGLQDTCKECQSFTSTIWMKKHPEESKASNNAYRQRNPVKVREWDRQAKVKRRRLLDTAVFEVGITTDRLFEIDNGICQLCGEPCERKDASHDHIIPLSKGGDHTWINSQLAHLKCNSSKKDRILEGNFPLLKSSAQL